MLEGQVPVVIPYFMREIIEQITDRRPGIEIRRSRLGRECPVQYRQLSDDGRSRPETRCAVLDEKPAVPRISDLGHLYSSSLGKLELDLMGASQMSERQVLDAIIAQAIQDVFQEYIVEHGLAEIGEIFCPGHQN